MGFWKNVLGGLGPFIYQHPFLVSFLGPLIGGEPFFVALAFLSGQGFLPLWVLFLSGTLADILDDMFWFFAPRWKWSKKIRTPRFISDYLSNANKRFKKIEEHKLFSFIMASKFLVGSRILAVISISSNKIKFRKFLPYSIISALIWSSIIISVGWLAGRGFSLISEVLGNVRITATILFAGFTLLFFIRRHLHKRVHKKLVE